MSPGAAATVPAAPCATSASRWPHGGWIEIVRGKDAGVPSRLLAEFTQQPGASIRISGSFTPISSEVWFCCPLRADRKGLQWRLMLPHSASAFPQRLLQTGQSAPGHSRLQCSCPLAHSSGPSRPQACEPNSEHTANKPWQQVRRRRWQAADPCLVRYGGRMGVAAALRCREMAGERLEPICRVVHRPAMARSDQPRPK